MTGGDADIVVSCAQVKLCVDFGQTKLVNEVHDQWYGVAILLGDFVEVPKVDTDSHRAEGCRLSSWQIGLVCLLVNWTHE